MSLEVLTHYLQYGIDIFVSHSDINYQINYVRFYNVLSVAVHSKETVTCFIKSLFPVLVTVRPVLVTVTCQRWL
jgi:hypothetical protein